MRPAIFVENLSKSYRVDHLGQQTGGYKTLRENLGAILKAPLHRFSNGSAPTHETFWALKDVSFEVKPGEVVGIIGRNGAGKSTLLKIVSRITKPSSGRVELRGRVGSLLEVGTGFHPELTGRENIYLNGSILGMRRSEIDRQFDAIVDFSGVERFLDTPVKRYSSGMYVRLAFAVAAHLNPEILIIDEVLAVGDAAFQKKCLGKMDEIATQQGRTILFVSHNMSAVGELCKRGILLIDGSVSADDATSAVITAYHTGHESRAEVDLGGFQHGGLQRYVRLTRFALLDQDSKPSLTYKMGESLVATIELSCLAQLSSAEIGLKICSRTGAPIHFVTSSWEGLSADLEPGKHVFEVRIPRLMLFPGDYWIGLWVSPSTEWADDKVQEVTKFSVLKGNVTGYPTRMEQYVSSGCEVHTPSTWRRIATPA